MTGEQTDPSGRVSHVRNALAGLLVVTAFVLPLTFAPWISDAFALPKVALLQLSALAGGVLFLAYVLWGGSVTRGADRTVDATLIVFGLLMCAATVVSADPAQSLFGEPLQYQGLVTTLVYVGSFYVARLSVGTVRRFHVLLVAVVSSGAITAGYAIAQWLGRDPFWSAPPAGERVIAGLGQANDLAAYLLLVLCAIYGLWWVACPGGRAMLLGVAALTLIALILTFSRGGYLALGVVALLVLAINVGRPRELAQVVAIAAIAIGIVGSASILPNGRATVNRVVDRAASAFDPTDGSIRSHLDLWALGLAISVDRPFLGTGPETFPLVVDRYRERVLAPDRALRLTRFRPESPHNEFIGVAAGSGLPALIAYLRFLAGIAMSAVRGVRGTDGNRGRQIGAVCLLVLTCHVATDFFKTPDATTSWLFLVMTGAGLAAMNDRAGDTPAASLAQGVEARGSERQGRPNEPSGYTPAS